MKKLSFRMIIAIGFILVIGVIFLKSNTQQWKGAFMRSLPAKNILSKEKQITQQKALQRIDRYSNDIAAINRHPMMKQNPLAAFLNNKTKRITDLKNKLIKVKDSADYDRIDHLLSHEEAAIDNAVSYGKKISNLPITLQTLQENFKQFQNAATLLQKKKPSTKAQLIDLQNAIGASLQALYRSYTQQSLYTIEQLMEKMRKQFVPRLRKIEKEEQDMSDAARRLRLSMQSFLPFFPYKVAPSPVTAGNSFSGTKKVLVCMMRWQGGQAEPELNSGTPAGDTAVPMIDRIRLETVMWRANNYFEQVSDNAVHLVFQYAGNDKIWGDSSEEIMPESYQDEVLAAIDICSGPNVNWSDLDFVMIYPSWNRRIGGVSLISRDVYVDDNGVPIKAAFSLVSAAVMGHIFPEGMFIHELVHGGAGANKGPSHANFLRCAEKPMIFDNCEKEEYGNKFDVMGYASMLGHLGSWSQNYFHWLDSKDIKTDGTYDLRALETNRNKRLLRIPYKENPLCLEYRKAMDYDDFLERSATLNSHYGPVNDSMSEDLKNDLLLIQALGDAFISSSVRSCLFLNICSVDENGKPETFLIDYKPLSFSSAPDLADRYEVIDACIPDGKIFENSDLGISLSWSSSVEDATGDTASVVIDIDETREFE